jgi:hypothetical protein
MRTRFVITVSSLSLIVCFALMLPGCGGKDPAPVIDSDKVKQMLLANVSNPWSIQSLIVDGVDKTTFYAGLRISFSDKTFTSTNGKAAWPPSGSWGFTDTTGKAIERSDGLVIDIVEIETNKLVLSLTWSTETLGPGRSNSIIGKHIFTFSK